MMTSSTYNRLVQYLLQKDQDLLRLSFKQIEDILGTTLPPSAYEHRAWWANSQTHSHARHGWLKAGYETSMVDLDNREVSFVRQQPPSLQSIPAQGKVQFNLNRASRPKGAADLNTVVRRAGGVNNLAEITNAIQAYINGDILETELGRILRKLWPR